MSTTPLAIGGRCVPRVSPHVRPCVPSFPRASSLDGGRATSPVIEGTQHRSASACSSRTFPFPKSGVMRNNEGSQKGSRSACVYRFNVCACVHVSRAGTCDSAESRHNARGVGMCVRIRRRGGFAWIVRGGIFAPSIHITTHSPQNLIPLNVCTSCADPHNVPTSRRTSERLYVRTSDVRGEHTYVRTRGITHPRSYV